MLRRGVPVRALSSEARRLVDAYRRHGYKVAKPDPLERPNPWHVDEPELALESYPELARLGVEGGVVDGSLLHGWSGSWSVQQLQAHVAAAYTGSVSFEFGHLERAVEREWWAERVESGWAPYAAGVRDSPVDGKGKPIWTAAREKNGVRSLLMAEEFELFLERKYPGLKRYSGEGSEGAMLAMEWVLENYARSGGEVEKRSAVIGMPHRGRLALLASSLRYPLSQLFRKLRGKSDFADSVQGVDDVSSHAFHSIQRSFGSSSLGVSLLPNPSHLEAINPVAAGKVRARKDAGEDSLCLLAHGDAAFSGQGVVPETLALSRLGDYEVGGSLHVVVNNQLGFTASAKEGRSTRYATDVVKGYDIPVIHVSAEDLPAIAFASQVAVEFRNQFRSDVCIDVVGWRKHGHNELDEPSFTQPSMYNAIRSTTSFPQRAAEAAASSGAFSHDSQERYRLQLREHLEAELAAATETLEDTTSRAFFDKFAFGGKWKGMRQSAPGEMGEGGGDDGVEWESGVTRDVALRALQASAYVPDGVEAHSRLERTHLKARREAASTAESDPNAKVLDWAACEAIAFGAALNEGRDVRIAGQDVRRGTFSHRHAALVCQASDRLVVPLNEYEGGFKGTFRPVSSPLSEFAALGFEYGYSLESPSPLVLWEAQFGDFANGAQIIIDQFLTSGETKWLRQSGLVLLLPHEYAGAGPEHSSAHPERFLQLANSQAYAGPLTSWSGGEGKEGEVSPSCAPSRAEEDKALFETPNFSLINPSTPAQYMHALRRQTQRDFRKPLVVLAPKSLLKLRECRSSLSDITETSFQTVLPDPSIDIAGEGGGSGESASVVTNDDVRRVLLCSGRVYYLLDARRRECLAGDFGKAAQKVAAATALVRVEQLCPFPAESASEILQTHYPNAKHIHWAQEEPANGGAWPWVRAHWHLLSAGKPSALSKPKYIGRPALATAAVGVSSYDKAQLEACVLTPAFQKM